MKNNVPDLRFQGFHDQWTLKYLEELAENFIGGGTPKTGVSEYWTGDIPWIQSSDLIKHKIYGFNSKKSINDLAIENSTTKIVPKDSIAVVTRVGVGKIALFEYQYSTSQDFLSFSKLNIDKWFGVYLLYNKMQKELKQVQGTSIKGITKAELLEKKVLIPKINEQIKIGVFFRTLDENICLHQKELEILKQTKQGFLQKMFPKVGGNIPDMRFNGFDDEWQAVRLGEAKDVRDGTHDSPKYCEVGFPLVTSKNLKEYGLDLDNISYISSEDYEAINKRSKVDIGDILFGMIGTIGNPVILKRDDFAIKNVALIKHGGIIQNQFLIQLLKSNIFKRFIENENAGNTQKFLSLSKIRNFDFLIPSVKEQIKIGTFFRQIDEVIELKEQKLEALKQTKKGFLQKMFV
ncbi:restriction endonuclease subunit S [Exiguobacterium acetylicum]|uniref:restriction endonuclease subunit S n=1 Tax=Exiguobacterium acetylicum TaxID=41170 RepID=UPI0034D6267E